MLRALELEQEIDRFVLHWAGITEDRRSSGNVEFYIGEVARAREEECRRLAREIHDGAIQSLAILALEMDGIARSSLDQDGALARGLQDARARATQIVDELRRVTQGTWPAAMDHGLVPALENLVRDLCKLGKLKVRLRVIGNVPGLSLEEETVIFRVAQEALSNVHRHSNASEALVRIQFRKGAISFSIADNGRGFALPGDLCDLAAGGRLGLIGIQERVQSINGTLAIKSRPGKGTMIAVTASPGARPGPL